MVTGYTKTTVWFGSLSRMMSLSEAMTVASCSFTTPEVLSRCCMVHKKFFSIVARTWEKRLVLTK